MRHEHHGGPGRDHPHHDHHHHHGPGGRHGRRGPGGRLFDYGELRLLLLAMLAERPSHGYELIKAIEERFSGAYAPSPGTVYPTLAWAEDMGYAAVEAESGNRKRYAVTPEGAAFLEANRAAADELLTRGGEGRPAGRPDLPAPVLRAMENLKLALRLRLREGPLEPQAAETVAAALDAAAKAVETSR